MLDSTIVNEEGRNNIHGYTEIKWRCKACGHIMNLPQQQNFNCCFHCGKKIIKKIGGEEKV